MCASPSDHPGAGNDPSRDPEVPEDKSRKQILVPEQLRDYIRERSREEGNTYSQQVQTWLPEDTPDDYFEFTDEDIVHIKATPECHAEVTRVTGKRVSPGDVIAFFAFMDALEQGHITEAHELTENVPDVLFDLVEQANDRVTEGSD